MNPVLLIVLQWILNECKSCLWNANRIDLRGKRISIYGNTQFENSSDREIRRGYVGQQMVESKRKRGKGSVFEILVMEDPYEKLISSFFFFLLSLISTVMPYHIKWQLIGCIELACVTNNVMRPQKNEQIAITPMNQFGTRAVMFLSSFFSSVVLSLFCYFCCAPQDKTLNTYTKDIVFPIYIPWAFKYLTILNICK